jgi:hypothetical protein
MQDLVDHRGDLGLLEPMPQTDGIDPVAMDVPRQAVDVEIVLATGTPGKGQGMGRGQAREIDSGVPGLSLTGVFAGPSA